MGWRLWNQLRSSERRALIILAVIVVTGITIDFIQDTSFKRGNEIILENVIPLDSLDVIVTRESGEARANGIREEHSDSEVLYFNARENETSENIGGKITSTDQKININLASSSELQRLPGIGPVYAERIVEFRNKNGHFKTVRDLLLVKGIGEKRLQKLELYIEVGSN